MRLNKLLRFSVEKVAKKLEFHLILMSEPASLERIDLSSIKKRLNESLNDKSSIYWAILKRFFEGRISKNELEIELRTMTLSSEQGNPMCLKSF